MLHVDGVEGWSYGRFEMKSLDFSNANFLFVTFFCHCHRQSESYGFPGSERFSLLHPPLFSAMTLCALDRNGTPDDYQNLTILQSTHIIAVFKEQFTFTLV
jgi:hypothetical protein